MRGGRCCQRPSLYRWRATASEGHQVRSVTAWDKDSGIESKTPEKIQWPSAGIPSDCQPIALQSGNPCTTGCAPTTVHRRGEFPYRKRTGVQIGKTPVSSRPFFTAPFEVCTFLITQVSTTFRHGKKPLTLVNGFGIYPSRENQNDGPPATGRSTRF
jgi:hypothetical protein